MNRQWILGVSAAVMAGVVMTGSVSEAARGRGASAAPAAPAAAPAAAAGALDWTGTFRMELSAMNEDGPRSFSRAPVRTFTLTSKTVVAIAATSTEADTLVRVTGPNGFSAENDDHLDLNPRLIQELEPGTYQVFIDTYPGVLGTEGGFSVSVTTGRATAEDIETLRQREADEAAHAALTAAITERAFETAGAEVVAVARRFSHERVVSTSRLNPISVAGEGFYGYTDASRPALTLEVARGVSGTLVVEALAPVEGDVDPLVFVMTSNGERFWNDDTELLNARVEIPVTEGMKVHVFTGTFMADLAPADIKLRITLR